MSNQRTKHEPVVAAKPAEVKTESGKVIEKKPDGSEVSMDPADAVETAQRLLEGAAKAAGETLISRGR